jgi:TatD DNase family protein
VWFAIYLVDRRDSLKSKSLWLLRRRSGDAETSEMKPSFYDTHAHLDFPEFEKEVPAIVARAQEAGITKIVTIGTTLEKSRRAIALAEQFPNVFAAIGWHPSHVTEAPQEIVSDLRTLAQHPKVVAIGEAGLDYSRLPSASGGSAEDDAQYKERQKRCFREQLELAAELGLNVIVHQRDSFRDAVEQIAPFSGKLRAVFHCFVGTPAEQKEIAELGFMVSFTGIVTFKNAATVRETLNGTGLGGFMLETDCPFLAPVPYRGKRCEPAYVANIAEFVAREKNCTLEELSRVTCATAESFFRSKSGTGL